MNLRLAALLFCACATGCKPGATTLRLDIDAAAGVTVQSLTLHVALGSDDAGVSEALPPAGTMPVLPGRAVVRLPDVAMDVAVALDGQDAFGAPLHAETTARTVPHAEVVAALTLGPLVMADLGVDDGGAPLDLSAPCVLGARCTYAYRRQLTVRNGAAAALPAGYTVRVPLDPTLFPSTKARFDLADLRVFGDPPADELQRVIDTAPPGQQRALWLALGHPIAAGASDTSYSIYYGKPTAMAAPNDPTQVFPFWDGFDNGAQLSAFWLTNGGPTVGGGTVTLHMNAQDALATNAATDAMPITSALEWRSRITDAASAGQVDGTNGTFWSWVGYQRSGDFLPQDPWCVWIVRGPTAVQGERKVPTGTTCNGSASCIGPMIAPDTAFHWWRVERDTTTTRFYRDGALSYSVDDPNDVDYSVMVRNYAVTSDLIVDWIRGRALAKPEPTVTVGAETTP
ncbi:MAG: hypothetical protein JWM53_3185 [bacterium]|nr:hypothetical protein [bacterium]